MGESNRMVRVWLSHTALLVVGILIGLLMFRSCGKDGVQMIPGLTDTIPGDSFPYIVYVGKPTPYKVVKRDSFPYPDSIFVPVPVEVANDFYSAYFYSDTLKNDTSALIVLNEQVTQNTIEYRELIFQNNRPTIINHIYPTKNNRIHLGVNGTLTGISAEIGYSYRANQFGLLYGTQGIGIGYRRTLVEW